MTQAKWLLVVILVLPVSSIATRASSDGLDGFSGNPATGGLICNECHVGGVTPTVTLSGPTLVQPGSTHTYSLTISGGQEIGGGLDVSVTDGFFTDVDSGTYIRNGEIVHRSPRSVDLDGNVSWFLNWTAPPDHTTVALYGAGNSVNLQSGINGDSTGTDVLTVTVGTLTPGETSGEALAPLRVTGFNALTGDLALSYAPGCETTSTNIYYGPLDQVPTLGWTGDVCNIGVSGVYGGFNPGPDSYFFIVVGTRNAAEGSYGRSLAADASEQERGPWESQSCGQVQDLSSSCN